MTEAIEGVWRRDVFSRPTEHQMATASTNAKSEKSRLAR